MDGQLARPTSDDDREGWKAYWTAQGMPWRTEPEISVERQDYLAKRRMVTPDVKKGVYPFRDAAGSIKLTRADVERLLATHDGDVGPVFWKLGSSIGRRGLDLRGADLRGLDLSGLPLACLVGGLDLQIHGMLSKEQIEVAAVHLEGASLCKTHMEDAYLPGAHLEGVLAEGVQLQDSELTRARLERAQLQAANLAGANLRGAYLKDANVAFLVNFATGVRDVAHLEDADLQGAHLEGTVLKYARLDGASLQRAYFDEGSDLEGIALESEGHGSASLVDVRWGGVSLGLVRWASLHAIGEEKAAEEPAALAKRAPSSFSRVDRYDTAARAYRQLAKELEDQGVSGDGARFAYRAQVLQRKAQLYELVEMHKHTRRFVPAGLMGVTGFLLLSLMLTFGVGYFLLPPGSRDFAMPAPLTNPNVRSAVMIVVGDILSLFDAAPDSLKLVTLTLVGGELLMMLPPLYRHWARKQVEPTWQIAGSLLLLVIGSCLLVVSPLALCVPLIQSIDVTEGTVLLTPSLLICSMFILARLLFKMHTMQLSNIASPWQRRAADIFLVLGFVGLTCAFILGLVTLWHAIWLGMQGDWFGQYATLESARHADTVFADMVIGGFLGLVSVAAVVTYAVLTRGDGSRLSQVRASIAEHGRYAFSLFLDAIAGYGYKPGRCVLLYVGSIMSFSLLYAVGGLSGSTQLSWNDALVLSVTAFHGRGFFPGSNASVDQRLIGLAATEAVIGLLIELSFIATFTRRYFGK